jgi:cyclophilin family peptidyl-prolyl cis-trans isomerase
LNRVILFATATFFASIATAVAVTNGYRAIEVSEFHRSLDNSLVAALDDPDPHVEARAALAIGRTKRGGVDALIAHGTATSPAVRAMCAYAIGLEADGRPESFAFLGSALDDANSAVRYAAVDAIGREQHEHPLAGASEDALATRVLRLAASDPDAVVRAHAAVQLDAFNTAPGAVRTARALERIEASDRDRDVRWHVAFTLYRAYATDADAAFLARMLHDPEELVRVETLRALGKRAAPATRPAIVAMLGDPSWRVQFEAREALRALVKLGRTEHLTAMPPGIHLPAIRSPRVPFGIDVATLGIAPFDDLAAPDPATLPLAPAPFPESAAAMNGPAPGPHPRVLVRTTRGDVIVRLYPEWAPSTVANFTYLAASGYFDGNRWFRIVPDFVTQTGDPTGDPDAEAGYVIPAEENPVEQRSGIIAMGLDYANNKPVRDSAGTQFYITLAPQPYLDRDFSVFGEIVGGFDVIANLVESDRMIVVRPLPPG